MSLRLGPTKLGEPDAISRRALFRFGIIKQVDTANCRVRVAFLESDEMLSYWLPVVVSKTQNDKVYWLPDLGEQVVCLMDGRDETGVVLGAIYSRPDRPPVDSADKSHIAFNDGSFLEYDRGSHVAIMTFQDGTVIKYDSPSHALSVAGETTLSVIVSAPGGITFDCGGSQLSVQPSGVSITPPLPISSTVAQT